MVKQGRIRSIDWLRGLAVVVMVQTHALALLRPDLKQSPLFPALNWIDGLVAPSFILAAGFSLALVQVRGAASGGRLSRAFKSLRRVVEVLLVSFYMTWIWFPLRQEPKYFLRVDILSCIGFTLLLALVLFALLARRPRALAALSTAAGLAFLAATPWREQVTGVEAHFLNTSLGSPFPMLPWSCYVFFGGALGALSASGDLVRMRRWLAVLVALGLAVRLGAGALIPRYPELKWWAVGNHGERMVVVGLLSILLVTLECHLSEAWRRGRVVRFFEIFGSSSLAAYFIHETLLFTRIFGFSFAAHWKAAASWELYWTLTAALVALTFVGTWIGGVVYERLDGRQAIG